MNIAAAAFLASGLAGCALAQNSDVAILLNVTRIKFDFFDGRRLTEYRVGMQGNYAWQILERPAGRLYLELPVSCFSAPAGEGVVHDIGPVREIRTPELVLFATPGIRYHLNVKPRLAVYVSLGGGIALRQQKISTLSDTIEIVPGVSALLSVRSGWKGSPAFNAGVGVDFRLTRLLSLRGEFRSFRTSSQPGFGTGRNFPSAHAGLGFHF